MFNRLEGELEAREKSLGLRMADLLSLPSPMARLVKWMLRKKQVDFTEISAFLKNDDAAANDLLAQAIERGLVREVKIHDETFYRVRMAPKLRHDGMSNIWDGLGLKVEDEEGDK